MFSFIQLIEQDIGESSDLLLLFTDCSLILKKHGCSLDKFNKYYQEFVLLFEG